MGCSLPGSSVNGIFQARVLEWGAIAFSACTVGLPLLFWGGLPLLTLPYMTQLLDQEVHPEERHYTLCILTFPKVKAFKCFKNLQDAK